MGLLEPELYQLEGVDLGGLRMIKRIGVGGMGEVWQALDLGLDIPVAVKVLPQHLAKDQNFVLRFLTEARAIAKLDHPNIVRVMNAGKREHEGQTIRLMVMELIVGKNALELRKSQAGGKLSAEDAARITLGVARALRYAHSRGVTHRDIKPANILVAAHGGEIKVLDFGLAKLASRDTTRTGGRSDARRASDSSIPDIVGTPHYMAPEQAMGKASDTRADIYSLGISLFELATGALPFQGESAYSVVSSHVHDPLPLESPSCDDLPPVFHELLAGMCRKDPADRLPLALIIERLESFLGVQPGTSTPKGDSSVVRAHTNLQARPSSFVGRESEMAALGAMVAENASHVVTILGPGGVGKTRFAQEFGLAHLNDYSGGVWFCDLTEARSLDGIAQSVAQGLRIPLTQGEPISHIHNSLRFRSGELLVILDNFEQVADFAVETLGVWMRDTPNVHFLTSSREALHLEGERAFALKPLESDDFAAGVALFIDRAKEAKRTFCVDASNRTAIQSIVEEVDGIPLAIELAAARVTTLSPQQIVDRLPRRFELLQSRRRDQSARQMTLRGAIDWSWNLLKPWEQLALAQCSVFHGGFFLEAAESVLDLSSADDAPFEIDVIEALCDKSLLRALEVESPRGEMRFQLLESVRDYAAQKMGALGGGGELWERHGKYFVNYAERWNTQIYGPQAVEALDRIEVDAENLLAVHDAFLKTQPRVAARALLALFRTLDTRGPWRVLQKRLTQTLASLPESDAENRNLRTKTLTALCSLSTQALKREAMLEFGEAAVASARSLAPAAPAREAVLWQALSTLGWAHLMLGSYDHAMPLFKEAESVARAAKDALGIATVVGNIGIVHSDLGDLAAAQKCFDEAEAIQRELGNRAGWARPLGNRGAIHQARGEHERALACCQEAVEIAREMRNPASLAANLVNGAMLMALSGEHEAALKAFTEAEGITRVLGDAIGIAGSIGNRGMLHRSLGEIEKAEACFREAEMIHKANGNLIKAARNIGNLGSLFFEVGRLDEAAQALAEASEIFRKNGAKVELAYCLFGQASVILGKPEASAELAELHQALAAAQESLQLRDEIGVQSSPDYFYGLAISAEAHRRVAALAPDTADQQLQAAREVAGRGQKLGTELGLFASNAGEEHAPYWALINGILGAN